MHRCVQIASLLFLLGISSAAETLDRIVAIVDNRPILQSEWDDAVALEAMMSGQTLASILQDSRRKTLDRMVDQQLLLEQMQADSRANDEDARRSLADLRSNLKLQKDADWTRYMNSYGLSEEDCLRQLAVHLAVLRFADFRLRANVKVDQAEIETFYRERLVPEVERRGAKPDPLSEVAPSIQRLLTEQKISEMLSTWLHNLRDQGTVRILINESQPAAPVQETSAAQVTKTQ